MATNLPVLAHRRLCDKLSYFNLLSALANLTYNKDSVFERYTLDLQWLEKSRLIALLKLTI
jgi:hypothetical protein